MKSKLIMGILLLTVLSGCSTVTTQNQNGQKLYQINCDGKLVGMEVCYKRAEKICPKGYTIVSNKGSESCSRYLPMLGVVTACEVDKKMGIASLKGITIKCK